MTWKTLLAPWRCKIDNSVTSLLLSFSNAAQLSQENCCTSEDAAKIYFCLRYWHTGGITLPAAGELISLEQKIGSIEGELLQWLMLKIHTQKLIGYKHTRSKSPAAHWLLTPNKSLIPPRLILKGLKWNGGGVNFPSRGRRTHLGPAKPAARLHEQPSLTTADNHPARLSAN